MSSPSRRRRVTVVVSHGCRVIPVLLSPPFCSYCRLCGCSAVVWSSAPASCCTCCVIVVVPELSRCRCRIVVLPALSCHHCHYNIVLSSCRLCAFVAVRSVERSFWEPCPVAVVALAVSSLSAPCCRHRTAIVVPSLSCRRLVIVAIRFFAIFVWKCVVWLRSRSAPEHVAGGFTIDIPKFRTIG